MENFINLVKIANKLDKLGEFDLADQVDVIVSKAAGERTSPVDSFIKKVKQEIMYAKKSGLIDLNSLELILNIIDNVAANYNFVEPGVKLETFESMKDETNIIIQSIFALEQDIAKLNADIKTEKDPEKLEILKKDFKVDRDKLEKLYILVDSWRNGKRKGDREKYERFEKLYNDKKIELGM